MIEIGSRARKLPAPPHVVWESLVDPHRAGARPEPPDASKTGHLRRRLNHLLFADLRYSYGN